MKFRFGFGAAFAGLAMAVALAGCSTTGSLADREAVQPQGKVVAASGTVRNQPLPPPTLNQANPKEYLIGPLDVINVSVFQAAELTGDFQVGAEGTFTFPLIGDVKASGLTSQQVQADIARRLRASYMQAPQVIVKVTGFNSQKVTVDGQVQKPGTFPVTSGGGTLLDYIAQAGGMPRQADPSAVLVFREVAGQRLVGHYNVDTIRTGQASDPLIYGGDKIVVAQSGIRSAWADLLSAVPIASFASLAF